MAKVSLDVAELAGFSLEFVLYGVFLVLFIQSQHLLLFSPRSKAAVRNTASVVLVTASFLLFLLTSAHFALDVSRSFDAFIYARDQPQGPAGYLGDLSKPKNVAMTVCYTSQTIIGDLIMVYRVYMVYGRNIWAALFPALMICGVATTGIGITIKFAQFDPESGQDIFASSTGHWIVSWFTVSLMGTLSSTCLISYRIWNIDRRLKATTSRGTSLSPIIRIIVESAAAYSAILAYTLFAYVGKSNIQFIGLDATSPTIGIVFTVIIVRLYDGRVQDPSSLPRSVPSGEAPHPLRNLNVTVSTTTRVDSDTPLAADDKVRMKDPRRESFSWSDNYGEV